MRDREVRCGGLAQAGGDVEAAGDGFELGPNRVRRAAAAATCPGSPWWPGHRVGSLSSAFCHSRWAASIASQARAMAALTAMPGRQLVVGGALAGHAQLAGAARASPGSTVPTVRTNRNDDSPLTGASVGQEHIHAEHIGGRQEFAR